MSANAVDFLTPLNDPNFYLGVDVEAGHIAAGLVAERPRSRSELVEGIEQRRAALIVGPSGAGKSALMWEAANTLRHTVRWFRVRRLSDCGYSISAPVDPNVSRFRRQSLGLCHG